MDSNNLSYLEKREYLLQETYKKNKNKLSVNNSIQILTEIILINDKEVHIDELERFFKNIFDNTSNCYLRENIYNTLNLLVKMNICERKNKSYKLI